MENFKDDFSKSVFGIPVSECMKNGICVSCHAPITGFRDALSEREYGISGLCQKCQDAVFGDTEDFEYDEEDSDEIW